MAAALSKRMEKKDKSYVCPTKKRVFWRLGQTSACLGIDIIE
jgi:hypothetical protein